MSVDPASFEDDMQQAILHLQHRGVSTTQVSSDYNLLQADDAQYGPLSSAWAIDAASSLSDLATTEIASAHGLPGLNQRLLHDVGEPGASDYAAAAANGDPYHLPTTVSGVDTFLQSIDQMHQSGLAGLIHDNFAAPTICGASGGASPGAGLGPMVPFATETIVAETPPKQSPTLQNPPLVGGAGNDPSTIGAPPGLPTTWGAAPTNSMSSTEIQQLLGIIGMDQLVIQQLVQQQSYGQGSGTPFSAATGTMNPSVYQMEAELSSMQAKQSQIQQQFAQQQSTQQQLIDQGGSSGA